jgi:hypothetical protein
MSRPGRRGRRAPDALLASCLSLVLVGCLDGRLDSFELVSAQGGKAGMGATAGVGGSSGAAAAGGVAGAQPSSTRLLDDFEDGDYVAKPDGWWYGADDGTGPESQLTMDEISGREGSLIAAHLAAGPTSGFGSLLGLDLPGGVFDLSPYAALSFWARIEPASELSVRFQSPQNTQYLQLAAVDTEWREFEFAVAEFVAENGTAIDPRSVSHLQFWIADSSPAFDLYIDDVRLLGSP